ncbi:hypothetical protein GWI33_009218 [Rhynchophorus ferrugineus]|uniref:Uncharacterized protein n=1 Tax=Rhynchophorus ferrugineus TaxID=354439 RepID=A0A834MFE5_RHYFE|nr:hypothetical protein GWI33_009218 [Rhynchophorus ferrugineus]
MYCCVHDNSNQNISGDPGAATVSAPDMARAPPSPPPGATAAAAAAATTEQRLGTFKVGADAVETFSAHLDTLERPKSTVSSTNLRAAKYARRYFDGKTVNASRERDVRTVRHKGNVERLGGSKMATPGVSMPLMSIATPSRDSLTYTTTKGLLNGPGQNNCFLNSAVQEWWAISAAADPWTGYFLGPRTFHGTSPTLNGPKPNDKKTRVVFSFLFDLHDSIPFGTFLMKES